ncbi:hypothetical protein QC763_605885 [Podospora pseudopauciseta]|uniref:Uncharacterized protein n=2 Tax=Podospora TaxID=5144 RepID=A0ABR0H3U1_9PEZI|nr:hypothetical protein QC763_605885 [Podospora pseudopauciseta]KAK4671030.1 hypothetical protein QC764_605885 [Podospora pseudoanserina]
MAATLSPPPALSSQQHPQQEFIVPCQAVWPHAQPNPTQIQQRPPPQPAFNPAHCHPVFFSDKLRRPPFALGSGPQLNPVAHGYVYQDGTRPNGKTSGSRL